jgi:DNA mismatch repair protein MutS
MDNLFTRIQGNDNIYQGLSSFAVEMLELKNIFNRANKKTMILGDELSHSTETVSGVSIVASSLMKFKELQSLYILATHLHQLPDIEEINEIEDINYFHLSTDYNPETNEIKFDRILKKGKGSSIYGLEFAASLELDNTFLKNAESIRKKITNDYSDVEKLGLKSTRYNDSKEKINCEVCGENAEDTHHITEQHKFKNGQDYFENVKKNHKHNLMSVCKKCHKDIHDNKIIIKGYVKTSKGFKLDFEKVENER